MSKVILQGYIIVPEAELALVQKELNRHIELTRRESGCIVFEVNQDPSDPRRFHVYEEFVDQSAFVAHQARVRDSKWGEVSVNVERHYKISGAEM